MQAARQNQLAASIEALICGDDASPNPPETAGSWSSRARHMERQKRQSTARCAISPPPALPLEVPNLPLEVPKFPSASPYGVLSGASSGFHHGPIGDGLGTGAEAADEEGAWSHHLPIPNAKLEYYGSHTSPKLVGATTVLPPRDQHHGTSVTHSTWSGPHVGQTEVQSMVLPDPPAQNYKPLSPSPSLELAVDARAVASTHERSSTARERTARQDGGRPQEPPEPASSTAAGWSARPSQRPHAVVEKRYRAGINDKIDSLRRQLEARKRPKHVHLHQVLLAICEPGRSITAGASTTKDHATGEGHATAPATHTSGQNASGPPGADGPTPAPLARMNKAEVLIEAVDYIQKLEDENEIMTKQLGELVARLRATRQALLPRAPWTSEHSQSLSPPTLRDVAAEDVTAQAC